MVEWHTKSKKLPSGGKRRTIRRCTKKKAWRGGSAANTKTGTDSKEERTTSKGRGNSIKVRATSTKFVNIPVNGKVIKAEIVEVQENNANRLFARSNIATKGATIKVKIDKGEKDAIITNRPGQDGVINAKLA